LQWVFHLHWPISVHDAASRLHRLKLTDVPCVMFAPTAFKDRPV
jgi:hypothetical protein